MSGKKIVIIGATGDVGTGICEHFLTNGYPVVAVGRSQEKLTDLAEFLENPQNLTLQTGSVEDKTHATELATTLANHAPDLVVTTVNAPIAMKAPSQWSRGDLEQAQKACLYPHFEAAQAIIPTLKSQATYLAIGGGMADLVFPGLGLMSVIQSAQRMMFRHIAKDKAYADKRVVELMIYSMIIGRSTGESDDQSLIRAVEIGAHVEAILQNSADFRGPILTLKSRKQIGQPEKKA